MTRSISRAAAARMFGVAVLLMAFGGCSGDDIQLEGKVFDAIGVGKNSKKASEPTLTARSPLVLPPNLERLPAPGAQPGGEAVDVAAINDPDKKLEVNQAELKRQQVAYCKVHYEQAIVHGDRDGADLAEGPLGPCKGSVLDAVDVKIGSEN